MSDARGAAPNDPILVTRRQAEAARFCFLGEFGYEIISWIPYLLYLKRTLGLKLRTFSRPGSSVFYAFSDDHREVPASLIGGVWGEPASYDRLRRRYRSTRLIHPGPDMINKRRISVEGVEWTTRDIHRPLAETNYLRLDRPAVEAWSPISGRPLAVINNKYFVQWPGTFDAPVNYFDRASLIALRDLLVQRGYGVVYNHFVEKTTVDEHLRLNDEDIFGLDAATCDLRSRYAETTCPADRNRLQISVYNAADFVIGPQGGNLYLPAVCRRPIFMLMRAGDYVDYRELGRLYGVAVEAFYEPRHLLNWLDSTLPRRAEASSATRRRTQKASDDAGVVAGASLHARFIGAREQGELDLGGAGRAEPVTR
ncbi:MAG: hypothetical protein FLDDKLPJ_00071 [Phycisphaerae bacterium]|nr:hypothetical protein [Phycisphaerae bacterium]